MRIVRVCLCHGTVLVFDLESLPSRQIFLLVRDGIFLVCWFGFCVCSVQIGFHFHIKVVLLCC